MLISDWFATGSDRRSVVKNFNEDYKKAFLDGEINYLMTANITMGDSAFGHELSKFFGSGFSIKIVSDITFSKSEIIEIGLKILKNKEFVRKLIELGWDSLYVVDKSEKNGCKWELMKYLRPS